MAESDGQMYIVINISESTFTDLKIKQNRTEVDNAVLNGTLLPNMTMTTLEQEPKHTKCERCPYAETKIVNICNYDGDGCGWD